ncbi:MAG: hypothetical protein HY716_18475 [Planctomycetes bacterium]|nr:hypothetical protein [Planctomycetota bacterium]
MAGACLADASVTPAPLSVRRGFAWTLAGYLALMLCQWGMLEILVRFGSKEQAGQFALALTITTPIVLFTSMGLRRVYATDAKAEFRFGDYFGLRIFGNVAALGFVALVAWAGGFRAELAFVILAMGMAKVVEATGDILHGLYQHRGRIDIGARATLFRGPFALAGFAAAFLVTRDVFWGIVGMGAGGLAILISYEWLWTSRFLRASSPDSDQARAGRGGSFRAMACLSRVALPLGLVALPTSLRGSIPVWVIAAVLGEGAVGLFVPLAYFHAASNRIVSALGEAAAARLAARFVAGPEADFRRLIARMLAVAAAIGAVGVVGALVAGRPLLRLLYGAEYAGENRVLVILMAAACVANLQTALDYAMTSLRNLRIQPYLYVGGALLLLLLCVVLVPWAGLPGAALALGIASTGELIASGGAVAWSLRRRRVASSPPTLGAHDVLSSGADRALRFEEPWRSGFGDLTPPSLADPAPRVQRDVHGVPCARYPTERGPMRH